MYVHIGEGILVKKNEVIAILDARKAVAAEDSPLFFEAFEGCKLQQDHPVKSRKKKGRKQPYTTQEKRAREPLVLFSAIATTTLQKRFHREQAFIKAMESREIDE